MPLPYETLLILRGIQRGPVPMAAQSKAKVYGRSPVLRSWVRMPPGT